jgi:hypothetical protein
MGILSVTDLIVISKDEAFACFAPEYSESPLRLCVRVTVVESSFRRPYAVKAIRVWDVHAEWYAINEGFGFSRFHKPGDRTSGCAINMGLKTRKAAREWMADNLGIST